jgi:hypothetical protein
MRRRDFAFGIQGTGARLFSLLCREVRCTSITEQSAVESDVEPGLGQLGVPNSLIANRWPGPGRCAHDYTPGALGSAQNEGLTNLALEVPPRPPQWNARVMYTVARIVYPGLPFSGLIEQFSGLVEQLFQHDETRD